MDRRTFIESTTAAAAASTLAGAAATKAVAQKSFAFTAEFQVADSLVHPPGWETLNPGYWQIKNGALRRRLKNVGDRARSTGFPFHAMSKGRTMDTQYDPSQPTGIIYRKADAKGAYTVWARFVYHGCPIQPADGDDPDWKMYRDEYSLMGIAIGAKSLFESHGKNRNASIGIVNGAGNVQLMRPGKQKSLPPEDGFSLQPGQTVVIKLTVTPKDDNAMVKMTATSNGVTRSVSQTMKRYQTQGYVGIAGRGLMDFEVTEFSVDGSEVTYQDDPPFDCAVCYPLGDTLSQDAEGNWSVRFVGMFNSDGGKAEVRVADKPSPDGGWHDVPVAGAAKIVNNDWRRNTASINVNLPASPASKALYYTVWKDGKDVTADTRVGTPAVGPGTGLVGDVPASGQYVGRLPQLKAPYKLCGLSCHAITSGLQTKTDQGYKIEGGAAQWQMRDQPSEGSYQHLDDYNFQVMVWEDDVWYMELVMYPPSTDDAYKIVKHSICGPTSRWQMMRHWNVINPGDHDYGMDDVKGPEQIAIRSVEGLGQDITYMQRNFQIVHHLTTGAEQVDPLENPKKWRAWKMPNDDFTFVILDSRLWRSSQDTDMWDDSGWENFKSLYDRTDPTRSLLGEEQFAWLQELVTTDSSRLMCLTGINGMHTIWTGGKRESESSKHPMKFSQRDRVTADYAGWVKAGSDRVLELLGSRDGIVTVYGDVHNGCIMTNKQQGIIECSFGPIGRSGGRGVIPGFGPVMKDVDGRDLDIHALYHKQYADAKLTAHERGAPFYWNFLEMEFDPTQADPTIGLRIRNLIDSPKDTPRGGNALETTSSKTGRKPTAVVGGQKTLASADVRFMTRDGVPLRGTRTSADGIVPVVGLHGIKPQTKVVMVVTAGDEVASKMVTAQSV